MKITSIIILLVIVISNNPAYAFTRISDLVFDGMSVNPDELPQVLETIKKNKKKNESIKNQAKLKPDKLIIINAKQQNPENVQIEIDTSQVVVKSEDDVQAAISNEGFLNAITDAVDLWNSVDITKAMFAPLKFASGQADPEDGKNLITFRGIEAPEGTPEGAPVVSIITFARTPIVNFMNKVIMVQPGTILDADIVFDPTNNPCLALHTTVGEMEPGGTSITIDEGGVDPDLTEDELEACKVIHSADITDFAVRTLGTVLGLESSAIASAATANTARIMTRYALTNDDEIGLANIYPNKETLTNHGNFKGKVLLNKKPVSGAHVVLENVETGEPVTGTITDIKGKFKIKAIPAGAYIVYAEPVDGPVRKNSLPRNFFGFTAANNFTTGILELPVEILANKTTREIIEVKELSASAFNINYLTAALTEADVNETGGAFLLPIRIMAGETLSDVQFWGSNVSPAFGALSISGSGCSISNIREDTNISISSFMGDPPPDVLPGIVVNITCDEDAAIGPRNIIYTGNQLDESHPSFGLRDQITGGLFIFE